MSDAAYARERPGATQKERSLSGRCVLIAEDEYLLANDLSQALLGAGARIVGPFAATNRALTSLRHEADISAAVLDVNLRNAAVYPLADALVERSVPFVFMTGYMGEALPDRFAAVPCCHKPLRPRDAVALLAQRLHGEG